MTPNDRRLDLLRRLAADYRPECVIELIWQACLTYDVESHRVRRLAEEELGLPYLRIETDYSPSDSARIAMRVEALLETVRARGEPAAPAVAHENDRLQQSVRAAGMDRGPRTAAALAAACGGRRAGRRRRWRAAFVPMPGH